MEEYIGLESKIKPFLFLVYNLSILGFMKHQIFCVFHFSGFLVACLVGCLVACWLVGCLVVYLLIPIQGIILQCKTTNKNVIIFNSRILQRLKLHLKYGFRSWFSTVFSLLQCEPEKSSPEEIFKILVSSL